MCLEIRKILRAPDKSEYLYAKTLRETFAQTRGRMRTNSPGTSNEWHSFLLPFEANDAAVLVGVNARLCACACIPIVFRTKREETSNETNSITISKFSIDANFDKSCIRNVNAFNFMTSLEREKERREREKFNKA